ncbi:aspartate ammonia-lyase [Curtobacterium sp. Leaf261]|uniref:aspartate ammonia-lyase n=1 Tax=Curtobacterium sp. Leaf261 TaxID=1736311 RepID=UPI0006F48CE1|nr:aspartate ammonia-lyase [Curtobacterium sp. Leaf261]KQO63199.1 aspartate ammonia-lyase [Curtobacterium sp. Leaf261]
MVDTRTETDSLGHREVPVDAYWGVNTLRALENFPITSVPISVYPDLIEALATVKQAAARANKAIGVLDARRADAIDQAAQEVRDGALRDQFVVDVVQGGAGTSTNMNTNEVLANRALEILGHPKGDYQALHPIDHVNRSQSTNDTYPTSIKLAMIIGTRRLAGALDELSDAFAERGRAFQNVLKVGRTQLQDAVPMTLGQEFTGFAHTIAEDAVMLRKVVPLLAEMNLGATAIGTGITADPQYRAEVRNQLAAASGIDVVTAPDLIEATSDAGVFLTLSGTVKRSAAKLSKICNDLRLLASGPQAGLGEITLPARQAGSSIMPGKVNPVIPEVVNQIAFAVAGADTTVTMAAEGGQLQLNAFEPIITHSILQSLQWMANGCATLRVHCVTGIEANEAKLAAQVDTNVGIVTALTPYIGYAAAASIAHTALTTSTPISTLVLAAGLMDEAQVHRVLSPARLSGIELATGAIPVVTEAMLDAAAREKE